MPTAHVTVDTEKTATRICDWAREQRVEHYVAPKPESEGLHMADYVTLVDLTDEQLVSVKEFLTNNGWDNNLEVE